ncbi:MAG: hypothetical protein GX591_20650 [Planctomycetes bacterium]|nr:hypothetical protein [Planctomycetota bacterium]
MVTLRSGVVMAVVLVAVSLVAGASGLDWSSVPVVRHAEYQAVNPDGATAYPGGGFPIRLIGVVLNNTEDWLDPTPAYDPVVHLWAMGGQAEFYVQALTVSTLDALGVEYYNPDDFGGTACWMGQNYGNHIMHQDPMFNYTDAEWTAELGRLDLLGGDDVTDPIRAGDLVEVRVRGGLHYSGKMNVNERHSNDPANDFEVVRLTTGFGLPAATPLTLADLKTADDTALFDPSRQTGGERHQSTLVEIRGVWVTDAVAWTTDTTLTVTDGVRTFEVYLALNPSFDGTILFGPGEPFSVVGIMDQAASHGVYSTDGYRLLVMNAADVRAVRPGDADGDGDVDLDDFVILKQNFGAAPLADGRADFDFDGDIDLDDFVILKQSFGTAPASGR